jgi:hypothetical protein
MKTPTVTSSFKLRCDPFSVGTNEAKHVDVRERTTTIIKIEKLKLIHLAGEWVGLEPITNDSEVIHA